MINPTALSFGMPSHNTVEPCTMFGTHAGTSQSVSHTIPTGGTTLSTQSHSTGTGQIPNHANVGTRPPPMNTQPSRNVVQNTTRHPPPNTHVATRQPMTTFAHDTVPPNHGGGHIPHTFASTAATSNANVGGGNISYPHGHHATIPATIDTNIGVGNTSHAFGHHTTAQANPNAGGGNIPYHYGH